MRSTLHFKFLIIYLIFGFLSIFTVATLSSELVSSDLEKETGAKLYEQASLIATNYLPGYFTDAVSSYDLQIQLNGLRTYLDSDIWLTDENGKIIRKSGQRLSVVQPQQISDFNPAEMWNRQYLLGTYHDYFPEEVITVIAPVTDGFSTKGYLLIHKPYASLMKTKDSVMRTIYITLTVIYLLSFSIFIGIEYFICRPLKKITAAAKEYASGNLEHEIRVTAGDEMGELSASLNYMSSQLGDMKSYQKKFIANVSHDFRSPLTSIKGYITAIADGTIPPELYEKYLNIILFETERLTGLTQDLLTLNEFDAKELLLDRTDFDIHDVIRSTAALFEGMCKNRRISIELLFVSRALSVHADKHKIEQVLYNLLDNAIKFSSDSSSITVETTEHGEKAFISVKDSGIGIPKKNLTQIWERFYKTDLSRGKDKKGSGLGLSIVREIIQAHGENINVISTEGVGTEFIFSIPKSEAEKRTIAK